MDNRYQFFRLNKMSDKKTTTEFQYQNGCKNVL